jgi:hypothetical protein
MNKDWQYSEEYKSASDEDKELLDDLANMMYEVQYARLGNKTEARRQAAMSIFRMLKGKN